MVLNVNKKKTEAIAAGQRALHSLTLAKIELEKARNWGIADMLGGGVFISLFKNYKLNKAGEYVQQAKRDLESFSVSIAQVTAVSSIQIDAGNLMSFVDVFADNVVADVLMQERIADATRQIDEAIYRVNYMLNGLKGR